MVLQNESNYDYYFIVKEELKGQFEFLVEKMEEYITFLKSINKENENDKTITCNIKYIDSVTFMARSL